MNHQKLFSVTSKDFEWTFVRGTGKGGQKRNKTSNAVRCYHPSSGASGFSQDGRSQIHNRRSAFRKTVDSPKFQNWLRLEIARHTGELVEIERKIDRELGDPNITVVEIVDVSCG